MSSKPYLILPPAEAHQKNALRLEPMGASKRCVLRPLDDEAKWVLANRPFAAGFFWWLFGPCVGAAGAECKGCAMARERQDP